MVRKIAEKVPDEQLHKDLDKYRQQAIGFGSTDAKVITTDMVLIDERVLAKCTPLGAPQKRQKYPMEPE